MNKYIDADRLIHDLEERIYAYSEGYADGDDCRKDAIETLLKDVKYQCSLQQEQPDFPTTDEQMKEFLATYPKVKVPEKYKNPDWLFKKQEQPSLPDLDEAAEEYMKKARKHLFDDSPIGRADDAFKAGAEWQKEQDTREMIMSDGSYFQKCYELGKKDMKEQMLKEAVEGFVATHLTSEGTKVTVNSGYLPKEMCIKPGDKVRIIIVKEEKK